MYILLWSFVIIVFIVFHLNYVGTHQNSGCWCWYNSRLLIMCLEQWWVCIYWNDSRPYIGMTVGYTFNFKGDYYEQWYCHLTFIYSYILQLPFRYDSVSIFLPCRESARWRKWPNEEDITQHIYPKWTFGWGWCKWPCMYTCPKKSVLVLLTARLIITEDNFLNNTKHSFRCPLCPMGLERSSGLVGFHCNNEAFLDFYRQSLVEVVTTKSLTSGCG